MAKETALLPKMEVLIIIIFFIGIAIWVFDKCGDTKRTYSAQVDGRNEAMDELMDRDTEGVELPMADTAANTAPTPQTTNPAPLIPARETSTTLFVTIDGLNLRDVPDLKGKVLTRLKLYEEVAFLGEVTDSTEQINLGKVVADEPWVKVQGRGHVGWVYGAGVSYYKKKMEGVQ